MNRARWIGVLGGLGLVVVVVLWVWRSPSAGEHTRPSGVAPEFVRAEPEVNEAALEHVRPQAGERAAVPEGNSELRLRLLRWPDGAPIAPRAVELARGGAAVPVTVEGLGRFRLARPIGTEPLVLEVVRYEPELIESARWQAVEELEVLLRPLDGLTGRVVEADGTPAVQVPVLALRATLAADVDVLPGRSPRVRVREELDALAADVTDVAGHYRLDVATQAATGALTVRAFGGPYRLAELDVELPRAGGPLEDLVLGLGPSVEVRVLDEGGAPIEGVVLNANHPRLLLLDESGEFALRTDVEGRCRVTAQFLPQKFLPMAPGWQPVGKRIDGIEVSPDHPVERAGQELEWTMRRAACVSVRVLDAVTGSPLMQPELEAEPRLTPKLHGRPLTSMWPIAMAHDGTTSFAFQREEDGGSVVAVAPDYDQIELVLNARGYEPVQRSVPRDELPPGGTLVLELEADATSLRVTGKVLAAGVPLAGARVAVNGVPRTVPDARMAPRMGEAETDDDGRFSILWSPVGPSQRVTVEARDPLGERLAFAGPLAPADAHDLTLEFEETVDVPVILAGAFEGEVISLHVEVDLEGDGAWWPSWTAKLAATSIMDGRLGSTVALPAHHPVRLTLVRPRGEPRGPEVSASFAPASPAQSITLEVARPRAYLRGRAVVSDPREHSVVLVTAAADGASRGGRNGRASTIDAQGAFAFERVPLGNWELLLVRPDVSGQAALVGREVVRLDASQDGLVLVATAD